MLYWELTGWFFFVVPWKTRTASHRPTLRPADSAPDIFRIIGILGFFSLHAGFGSCMRLEQFVWARLPNRAPGI